MSRISIPLLFATTLMVGVGAQEQRQPSTPNIRVQSDLLLINTLVTDAHGAVITDLDATRLHLFEDGHEQTLKYCGIEESPVSIGLVLDTSASMGDNLNAVKKAASEFVRAANLADEYFIIGFGVLPQVLVPFTSDAGRLISAIDSMQPGGSTALVDAVHLAVSEIRNASHPRTALLVMSDGMDNHSRYSARETKRLALEADSAIYIINLWHPPTSGNLPPEGEALRPEIRRR